jgi:hypothetical protein
VSASRGAHDHIDTRYGFFRFAFIVTWPIEREASTGIAETAVKILWSCLSNCELMRLCATGAAALPTSLS